MVALVVILATGKFVRRVLFVIASKGDDEGVHERREEGVDAPPFLLLVDWVHMLTWSTVFILVFLGRRETGEGGEVDLGT
jgi:hypothetical protein